MSLNNLELSWFQELEDLLMQTSRLRSENRRVLTSVDHGITDWKVDISLKHDESFQSRNDERWQTEKNSNEDLLPIQALRASRLSDCQKTEQRKDTSHIFTLQHSQPSNFQLPTSNSQPTQNTTAKMVAINSLLSVIAISAMATAAPAELVARGESVANYRFFTGPNCPFSEQPTRDTLTALLPAANDPPLKPTERAVGTCYTEANFGSIVIFNINDGCRWEQYLNTTNCTGTPLAIKTSSNPQCLTTNGAAPRNSYKFTCGN
ncbi:hypothetical protein VTL71DRAFT_5895 [Oculimacula yallundae]|uniref:Uncharacterized protein n=1 Tax=Oculimacula yallundae TaxID=86028 RepID=A0ABR4BYU2_9HELO